MLVADEGGLSRGGVRVVVAMGRATVGKAAGGFEQAMGIRSRKEWLRHKVSRRQLVGTTEQKVQAGGGRKVLVVGREAWGEWMRQVVDGTEWSSRGKAKGQWDRKQ